MDIVWVAGHEAQTKQLNNCRDLLLSTPPDQWTFLPSYSFTTSELIEPSGFDLTKIKNILNAFSFDQSSTNLSFNGFSDFNEVNASPIIKIDADSFVLFMHYKLLEALYETPFYWMVADKKYSAKAAEHRGHFTEQFLYEKLSSVFGEKNVLKNIDIYKGKNRITEADILVQYGKYALVIQAKSKKLTIEARKGNDNALKNDFKKAIQDAYDQSWLCSQALLDSTFQFKDANNNEITLKSTPQVIFPICAVSDHYPALSLQARQFLKMQSNSAIRSAVITDVFFIDVLADLLKSPLHFLNYLELRTRFDDKFLASQELVMLGYHLKHNLWGEGENDFSTLDDRFTSDIDIAIMARRAGNPGNKVPEGILTRFDGTGIGKLLKQIQKIATPELIGLGMLFLQLSSEGADNINNCLDQLIISAMKKGTDRDFSIPFTTEKAGFTVHINSRAKSAARESLIKHCEFRKYVTKSDAWYGLILSPSNAEIKGAFVTEGAWIPNQEMENIVSKIPQKPEQSLSSTSSKTGKKIGRNDQCPCFSGKKYKKCCL